MVGNYYIPSCKAGRWITCTYMDNIHDDVPTYLVGNAPTSKVGAVLHACDHRHFSRQSTRPRVRLFVPEKAS